MTKAQRQKDVLVIIESPKAIVIQKRIVKRSIAPNKDLLIIDKCCVGT